MSEYVRVGQFSDFPEGRSKVVKFQGKDVAVFNVKGRLMAIQDSCPHQGASLADGRVTGMQVTCHRHDWVFSLETGLEATRSRLSARVYEVKLSDQGVFLRLPQAAEEQEEEDWPVWDDGVHLKSPRSEDS